jgi:hypothetical protein
MNMGVSLVYWLKLLWIYTQKWYSRVIIHLLLASLMEFCTDFHRGCTSIHSQQVCMQVPFPHILQTIRTFSQVPADPQAVVQADLEVACCALHLWALSFWHFSLHHCHDFLDEAVTGRGAQLDLRAIFDLMGISSTSLVWKGPLPIVSLTSSFFLP